MKTYWSAFLSLLFLSILTGCGNEEFGTGGQQANSTASPLKGFSNQSCSNFTLIKPKVDIVYIVDNSTSTLYVPTDIQEALKKTIDTISNDFDYRVIGTPLIPTDKGNDEYQVMTNSPSLNGILAPKVVQTANQFDFFTKRGLNAGQNEQGFDRTYSFVSNHKGSLIRNDAHIIVVLVSNGRDNDVERFDGFERYYPSVYSTSLSRIKNLKNPGYQLRFNSVTSFQPLNRCPNNGNGYASSERSYVQMSKDIYLHSKSIEGVSDQDRDSTPDAYDLCGSEISSIFTSVNSSIQQVLIAHKYRFWPVSFAENSDTVDPEKIQVTRIASNGVKTNFTRNVDWTYEYTANPVTRFTREVPTPGEPITGSHFIRFNQLLEYPDCVLVSSVSKIEFYDYVVLPRKPLLPVTVKVNGVTIPQSALSTSQVNTSQTLNIKANWPIVPGVQNDNPPVMRTGFMIQITNPQYFYKSGDNIETLYTPASI